MIFFCGILRLEKYLNDFLKKYSGFQIFIFEVMSMSVTKDEFKEMFEKSKVKFKGMLGKRKKSNSKDKQLKVKKRELKEKPDYEVFLQ